MLYVCVRGLYCDTWSCRCLCMGSMSFSSCRCCMFVSCVHPVCILQTVELSQWTQAAVQIVSNLPTPSNGGQIYRFLLGMTAMRTRWMTGAAAHKSG